MTSRRIPCTDCAAERARLEAAGFVVDGCEPDGTNGMCLVTFHDSAAVGAPSVARTAIRPAAAPESPAWNFGIPDAATAVVNRIGAQPGGLGR